MKIVALLLTLLGATPQAFAQQSEKGPSRDAGSGDAEIVRRVDALLATWRAQPRRSARGLTQALRPLGRRAVPRLLAHLEVSSDVFELSALVSALGAVGDDGVLPALTRLGGARNLTLRIAVVDALTELATMDAAVALVEFVADPELRIARRAAGAIATLGRGPWGMMLGWKTATRMKTARDKSVFLSLLARLDPKQGHDAARALLQSKTLGDRRAAVQALATSGAREDGALVQRTLKQSEDPRLIKEACLALGRQGRHAAIPDLIPLLDHDGRGVAENALWALRRLTDLRLASDAALWRRWWEVEGQRRYAPKRPPVVDLPVAPTDEEAEDEDDGGEG